MTRKYLLILLLMCIGQQMLAQESYLYLEPIKGLPCKVLMNQKEITVATRNYFLIPIQGNGEYTFDILFGNNLYPKQTFIVDVVEGSGYGYKLARTGENKFYLLDLVNNGKIIETNTAVNIGLTTEDNTINFYQASQHPQPTAELSKAEIRKLAKLQKEKEKAIFLEQNQHTTAENPPKEEEFGVIEVITSTPEKKAPTKEIIRTTKCATTTASQEIDVFAERLNQKNDDESKLILVRKKSFTGCITCLQAYSLVEVLRTQYGRFSAAKILRTMISDPENIKQLEPLFKTESYKSKLREL